MPNSRAQQMAIAVNRAKRAEAELELERALWESPATEKRLERGDPDLMHTLESLEAIIRNHKRLKDCTGRTIEEFNYLERQFNEAVDRTAITPLFRDGGAGASALGNRCKLLRRYAMLLVLTRISTGATQGHLASQFGVDQGVVCRYIQACMPILEAILPTPDKIFKEIAGCETDEERMKFLADDGKGKGKMLLDSTRTPHVRPSGEEQKDYYSGKD